MSTLCKVRTLSHGGGCVNMIPITIPAVDFYARPGFFFPSEAEAGDETYWNQQIAARQIFVAPRVRENTPADFETSINETSLGYKELGFEGKRGTVREYKKSLETHKYMRDYMEGKDWVLYKCDANGVLQGWRDEQGRIFPFELSFFHVHYQMTKNGDINNFTRIEFQEEDVREWDNDGFYWRTGDFNIKKLKNPVIIEAIVSTVAANVFTLTLQYVNRSTTDPNTGEFTVVPITGATTVNLELINESGVLLDSGGDYTVTETAPGSGVYTVDATVGGLVSGTVAVNASYTDSATNFMYHSKTEDLTAA